MHVGTAALPAFNHLLARAEWARNKLIPFAGRRAVFLMTPWRFEFQISPSGLFEEPGSVAGEAIDVEIALPAQALLSVLHDPAAVMRTARISGSAEFAEALGFVLTRIRWDAEEDIATWVGDIPARRLTALFGKMAVWQKQAAQRLGENLAEFLTAESSVLAGSANANHFVAEVDVLRDDVARLEKRIQRLE